MAAIWTQVKYRGLKFTSTATRRKYADHVTHLYSGRSTCTCLCSVTNITCTYIGPNYSPETSIAADIASQMEGVSHVNAFHVNDGDLPPRCTINQCFKYWINTRNNRWELQLSECLYYVHCFHKKKQSQIISSIISVSTDENLLYSIWRTYSWVHSGHNCSYISNEACVIPLLETY